MALLQAVAQQSPVGQAGQGIEMGNVLQLLFVFFLAGDVGKQRHVAQHVAIRALHRADGQQLGVHLAGLAAVPDFTGPATLSVQAGPQGFVERLALPPGAEQAGAAANDFVARIAGDADEGLVHVDQGARRVGDHDGFLGVAEHAGGELQRIFCGFALADVLVHAHHAQRVLFGIALGDAPGVLNPEPVALRMPDPVLADVVGAAPLQVFGELLVHPLQVLRVHAVLPFAHMHGFARLQSQHLAPARRDDDLAAGNVPVPGAQVAAFQRQFHAFLAVAQRGLHAGLLADVGQHPRKMLQRALCIADGVDRHPGHVGVASGVAVDHLPFPGALLQHVPENIGKKGGAVLA